jgi:uncharacterized repeat protein (TIGR03803 family)
MTHAQPFPSNPRAWTSPYVSALALAAALAATTLAYQPAQAQMETVLYSFKSVTDGALPSAGVIRDGAGNLYGTTINGGTFGWGIVFKLSKTRVKTVLYNFTGKADGAIPNSGLFRDATGNLYGTTETGGDLTCNNGAGCGTVFKLSAAGQRNRASQLYRGNVGRRVPLRRPGPGRQRQLLRCDHIRRQHLEQRNDL